MKKAVKQLLKFLLILFLLVNIIAAFHAYKFTHFYDADKVTIKKPENKSGWDITKDILFGIDAVKKKNTIAPDSAFQTVYLKSSTCPKLEAWYILVDSAKGTICMFHGHGGNKSDIFDESKVFSFFAAQIFK